LGPSEWLTAAPILKDKVVVSIMFTGMVYGEYILAIDEAIAAKMVDPGLKVGTQESRELITETFSEILNIIVGESIVEIANVFKKLTITAPKVIFGGITYPKVKAARVALDSGDGAMECFLYVDRMKLDIADSYKDAMSSLVRANNELRSAMTKLQEQQNIVLQAEKMGALGTMAAGVAHEINSPLATISLLGSQLKDLVDNPAQIVRADFVLALDTIEETVQRISKITNSLRTFANGLRGETYGQHSVKSILDNAVTLTEEHCLQKQVKLIRNNFSDLVVECKPIEICQVLVNIINNCCDAVEQLPDRWIKIEVNDSSDGVEIRILDSGRKIPEDVQKKMFDPFFTTKAIGKGSGLGLSVAKGIVDAHFGSLKFEPNHAHTCFVLRLPKKRIKVA